MFGPNLTEQNGPLFDRIARFAAAKSGMLPPTGLRDYFPSGLVPDVQTDDGDVLQPPVPPAVDDDIDKAFGLLQGALMEDPRPEVKTANLDLWNELQALAVRIRERLAQQRDSRLAHLRSEAARLYEACRAALDNCRQLSSSKGTAEMRLNATAQELVNARRALTEIQQRRPSKASYPKHAEIQAWARAENAARQSVTEAEASHATAERNLQFATDSLHRAETEFQRLHSEHSAIEARIAAGAPIESNPIRPDERPPIGLQG